MHLKRYLSIFLALTLFLINFNSKVEAAAEHSIKKLTFATKPKKVKATLPFDISVSFTLNTETGIQTNRLRASINGNNVGSPSDFEIEVISPTKAKVTFTREAQTISDVSATNKFKVSYFLTSDSNSKLLATSTTSFLSLAAPAVSNPNPDPTTPDPTTPDPTTPDPIDVVVDTRRFIVQLSVEEINEEVVVEEPVIEEPSEEEPAAPEEDTATTAVIAETEFVSLEPKQFRLTIDHDKEFIPGEQLDFFDTSSSVLLNALKITRINREGIEEDASTEFIFDLENSSQTSPDDNSLFRTKFLSQELVLKEIQKLRFKINLKKFLNNVNVSILDNFVFKDKDSISIDAVELTVTNSSLESGDLLYEPLGDTNLKKLNLLTAPLNLGGSFVAAAAPSNDFQVINFFRELDTKTDKANLKFGQGSKAKLLTSGVGSSLQIAPGAGTNFSFTLPVQFRLDQSRSAILKKRGILDLGAKTVNLPFEIITKDVNDLDVKLTGKVSSSRNVTVLDDPKFTTKNQKAKRLADALKLQFLYSNIVAADTDPLDLEIVLLDSSGTAINGNSFIVPAISKIKSRTLKSKKKVSHKKLFKLKANDSTLGAGFNALLGQASSVLLRLRRTDTYLASFGLSYVNDGARPSLIFADGVNQITLAIN